MSIELVNVSKAFGETQVLRGLSERFAQGEAVCVMGRSGLGKTTLARIVMGLEKPDAGCLLYTSPSPRDRQKSRMPSSA